ncbi:Calcium/calmodulin-dependent protein kinase type I [Mycoemilia scoparia]|uniref:Calcium/calmodulin-dependent protein kinase type I n=1 Tax=Mycoemilia scoparia TaxID=417184 RepID=A0A9W8A2H9_9FUNG|nr:Calcium/calmodulin-dependent protein kinase type I [Mycoemilia scoparia]
MTYSPKVPDGEYRTGRKLGSGNFGSVFEAKHLPTNEPRAIKIIQKRPKARFNEMVQREVNILLSINHHPHIVKLYKAFEHNNLYYLIFELCRGDDLYERLGKAKTFSERNAQEIMRICFETVSYLHDHGVVHRDIKPQNILFRSERFDSLVLADFGISRMMQWPDQKFITRIGTPAYMAPEVLTREGYGTSVDIWSLGVMMHVLLGGNVPWDVHNLSIERWYFKILNSRPDFSGQQWVMVSDSAKELISQCLVASPDYRITAKRVIEESKWLTEHLASTHDLLSDCITEEDEAAAAEEPNGDTGEKQLKARPKYNFGQPARKFRKAIIMIRAINRFKGRRKYALSFVDANSAALKGTTATRSTLASSNEGRNVGGASGNGNNSGRGVSKPKSNKSAKHRNDDDDDDDAGCGTGSADKNDVSRKNKYMGAAADQVSVLALSTQSSKNIEKPSAIVVSVGGGNSIGNNKDNAKRQQTKKNLLQQILGCIWRIQRQQKAPSR